MVSGCEGSSSTPDLTVWPNIAQESGGKATSRKMLPQHSGMRFLTDAADRHGLRRQDDACRREDSDKMIYRQNDVRVGGARLGMLEFTLQRVCLAEPATGALCMLKRELQRGPSYQTDHLTGSDSISLAMTDSSGNSPESTSASRSIAGRSVA